MSTTFVVFTVVLCVMAYAILRWRLMILSQPIRKDFARRGERLIASGKLPDKHAKQVKLWLNTTFQSWRIPVGVVVVPFVAIIFLFRPSLLKDDAEEIVDDDTRREYRLVLGMSVASDLLLSPLSGLLLLAEAFMLTLLFVPVPRFAAATEKVLSSLFAPKSGFRKQGAH